MESKGRKAYGADHDAVQGRIFPVFIVLFDELLVAEGIGDQSPQIELLGE